MHGGDAPDVVAAAGDAGGDWSDGGVGGGDEGVRGWAWRQELVEARRRGERGEGMGGDDGAVWSICRWAVNFRHICPTCVLGIIFQKEKACSSLVDFNLSTIANLIACTELLR